MSYLSGSPASTPTQGDLSKDVAVKDPPEDSISCLAFSRKSEHLAVASWDKKVRIYEIDGQGQSQGKALFEHEGPVLSCAWSPVGDLVDEESCFVGTSMCIPYERACVYLMNEHVFTQ